MNDDNMTGSSQFSVLYVDDEEMALKYFRRAVGPEFEVHTATNVEEGLETLGEIGDQIGVLITDQRMPGRSGVELLKRVRERWPHIVRILTTAYADLDDAIEAVNRGEIFRYITKPWDIKALRAEVTQAMEVFRLQHENAALMQEKLTVWQRLIQLGRVRDLVIMGNSLAHLRHSDRAMAAYLQDHLDTRGDDAATFGSPDIWNVTEAELNRSVRFVNTVVSRTGEPDGAENASPRAIPVGELIALADGALGTVEGTQDPGIPAVTVVEQTMADLLKLLGTLRPDSDDAPTVVARAGQSATGGEALVLDIPAPPRSPAALTADESADPLSAYLLAFHQNAALRLKDTADGRLYQLTVPVSADEEPPKPSSDWLERLLMRLEGWD